MTPKRKNIIPDVISDQSLVRLDGNASVRDAAILMDQCGVSSVLVIDGKDRLRGIFTVRDVARRVVGGDLDPRKTRISEVMTENPQCIAPDMAPQSALRLMQEKGFRHLPVTEDGTTAGRVLGVVSRRNFFPEEETLLKMEEHLWETMR
ncbi:MAG: CBS domain-containing protein [Rickettsiales bacterium]